MQRNEITRLNTALEYAKAAEENRRQMTSNIAHELKTPLAVIHSYAEGLKEHIAEDKRDKYVDVILAEAERTDGMVLEMLDLSRLEAGKVKLSRDEFSLADLTKAIFEKLQMAAEAKELQISYEFPEQSTIVADENRIAQVVENFATNAVKYTPPVAVSQYGFRTIVVKPHSPSKMTASLFPQKLWLKYGTLSIELMNPAPEAARGLVLLLRRISWNCTAASVLSKHEDGCGVPVYNLKPC